MMESLNDKSEAQRRRQPYEKPRLRAIELAADEVLSTGCKMVAGGTGYSKLAPPPCKTGNCFGPGT
jgi:hypothetical protein